MGRPVFTPAADEIIERYYPTYGPGVTQARLRAEVGLDVHRRQIRYRAGYRGILWGVKPGTRSVHEVATEAGVHHSGVRRAAERAGVHTVVRSGRKRRVLVPDAWADAFIDRTRNRANATELHGHHYTTAEAAAAIGIAERTLSTWLYRCPDRRPKEGERFLQEVRRVYAKRRGARPGGGWLFNPYDVEAFVRSRGNGQYVNTRQAAEILGCSQWAVRAWADGTVTALPGRLFRDRVRVQYRGHRRHRYLHVGDLQAFKRTLEASDA